MKSLKLIKSSQINKKLCSWGKFFRHYFYWAVHILKEPGQNYVLFFNCILKKQKPDKEKN